MAMTRFEAKCWRAHINEGLRKAGRVEAAPKWQWEHGLLTLDEYLDDVWQDYHSTMSNVDIVAELGLFNGKGLPEYRESRGV